CSPNASTPARAARPSRWTRLPSRSATPSTSPSSRLGPGCAVDGRPSRRAPGCPASAPRLTLLDMTDAADATVPAHLAALEDPFQWLEEVEGTEALAWVAERNAHAAEVLASRPGFE